MTPSCRTSLGLDCFPIKTRVPPKGHVSVSVRIIGDARIYEVSPDFWSASIGNPWTAIEALHRPLIFHAPGQHRVSFCRRSLMQPSFRTHRRTASLFDNLGIPKKKGIRLAPPSPSDAFCMFFMWCDRKQIGMYGLYDLTENCRAMTHATMATRPCSSRAGSESAFSVGCLLQR